MDVEDATACDVSDAVVEEDDAVDLWVVASAGAEAVVAAAVGSVFDFAMCDGIGTLEVASVYV